MKSARVREVQDLHDAHDVHERPTLAPMEDSALSQAMEARVLFEARAAEERRRAATEGDRPTRRVEAQKTLMGMSTERVPHPEPAFTEVFIEREHEPALEVEWEDARLESRRSLVHLFALTLLLAIVASIAVPVAIANKKAAQNAVVTLLRAR